jgi:peptidoglycan hydrolase CwlO-like protein
MHSSLQKQNELLKDLDHGVDQLKMHAEKINQEIKFQDKLIHELDQDIEKNANSIHVVNTKTVAFTKFIDTYNNNCNNYFLLTYYTGYFIIFGYL